MGYFHILRSVTIVCALVLLGFSSVQACSCRSQPSLLTAFDSSESVVTARLVAVTKYVERSAENGGPLPPTATMVVEKVYKGNIKAGAEIKFRFGGTNCDVLFDERDIDSQYLFYLGKPDASDPVTARPIYRQTICSRPTRLKWAAADLAYLDNIDRYRGRTRVSGMLMTGAELYASAGSVQFPSVEGVAITFVAGKKIFKTRTLANGLFELYDLPPGEYKFHAALPKGWKLSDQSFAIREKQQAEISTSIEPDTIISGRVISSAGKPIEDINVKAIPAGEDDSSVDENIAVSTDKEGGFEIDDLMPGLYKIVVNGHYPSEYRDAHYSTTYYPGVAEESNAAIVSVELGKPVTGINIRMSPAKESIEIGGVLKYSDGTPASGALVVFSSDDQDLGSSDAQAKTDKNGGFLLRVIRGVSGSIIVEENDDYATVDRCRDTRTKRDPVTGYTEFVTIKNLEIDTSKPVPHLVLTFPFDPCPEQ